MTRLQSRLKVGTKWVTALPPLVFVYKNIELARNVKILRAGLIKFEVIDMSILPSKSYTLDLQKIGCGYDMR